MLIQWSALPDLMPATGYQLFLQNASTGASILIYDGRSNPNVLQYLVSGLATGSAYTFTLVAWNFNGQGSASSPAVFTACTAPAGLASPSVQATTQTSITLVWTSPADNGGCSITGFHLYMDDGQGGALSLTDDPAISGKPYLTGHTVNFSPS